MTWHQLLYDALLLAVCAYAGARGGAPERIAAGLWLANNLASAWTLARSRAMYVDEEGGLLLVDLLTLALLVLLALRANRRWPIAVVGMHGGGIAVHVCKLLQPDLPSFAYALGTSIWGYPILLAIAAGTVRHQARLRRIGIDPSWERFSQASTLNRRQLGPPG